MNQQKAITKLLFGLLGLSAVVTEIVVLSQRGVFEPSNFFSYFTIQSNCIAAIFLIMSGGLLLLHKPPSVLFNYARGAATLYVVITGIVFSLLLSGLDITLTAVPWDNIVLHYLMPVAVLVDWLLDPPRHTLKVSYSFYWLFYPIMYLVYSLVRGEMTGWYPYPFLNPTTGGYESIAVVTVGIAIGGAAISYCLTTYSQKRRTV